VIQVNISQHTHDMSIHIATQILWLVSRCSCYT